MAVGKTLTVYLAADVDKLRKGLRDADSGLSGFSKSLTGMVGPALIGATAAAGAFAVAIGVKGVEAAMEEEKELAKLGTTLNNLGFGAQSEKVNAFIDDLQYTAAVTDSELRPAFDRLVRSTGSITEAQDALGIALDVSAGTGKSLEAVANALGKAYDGNTGALGKLGVGLDSATLKSGDMNAINEKLTLTFQGQSEAAAATAAGGMKKLQIATDELIESFGTGLIGAMDSSSTAIDNNVQRLRNLQPAAENVGSALGDMGTNALVNADRIQLALKAATSSQWGIAWQIMMTGGDSMIYATKQARALGKQFEYVQYQAYEAAAQMNAAFAFGGAETGGTPTSAYNGINSMNNMLARMRDRLKKAADAAGSGGGGGGGGGLTKAIKEMNPQLRAQIDLVKDLTTQVDNAAKAFDQAQREMNDWIDSMAGKITAGIDLGTAFAAQFDNEGKKTGQSLLDGFQKQIDQAGLFGGYLQTLNTEGGPELRDAVAALGPDVGNKLAKQIIDEGLVKTFQDKLVTVKTSARRTAEAMTPEFLIAGVNSAAAFLFAAQDTLAANAETLRKMGESMGKTIGEAAAKEIRDALAAAGVAQTNATAAVTAGVTPQSTAAIGASLIAGSPMGFISSMSTNSIAQAISRAISDSDQRLGRSGQAVLQ